MGTHTMRLDQLHGLVAGHASQRYLEKRGNVGIGLPALAGLALQAPGIGDRAGRRAHNVAAGLDDASRQLLDGSYGTKQAEWGSRMMQGAAGKLPDNLGGSPPGFKNLALHVGGIATGAAMAAIGSSLLKDMYAKAKTAIGNRAANPAREAIITQLKKEDPILMGAEDKTLMEAYHTMVKFAPKMSTDKNAVRSFLRQAVMSGAGPDFTTIKLLADAERAVTQKDPVK